MKNNKKDDNIQNGFDFKTAIVEYMKVKFPYGEFPRKKIKRIQSRYIHNEDHSSSYATWSNGHCTWSSTTTTVNERVKEGYKTSLFPYWVTPLRKRAPKFALSKLANFDSVPPATYSEDCFLLTMSSAPQINTSYWASRPVIEEVGVDFLTVYAKPRQILAEDIVLNNNNSHNMHFDHWHSATYDDDHYFVQVYVNGFSLGGGHRLDDVARTHRFDLPRNVYFSETLLNEWSNLHKLSRTPYWDDFKEKDIHHLVKVFTMTFHFSYRVTNLL